MEMFIEYFSYFNWKKTEVWFWILPCWTTIAIMTMDMMNTFTSASVGVICMKKNFDYKNIEKKYAVLYFLCWHMSIRYKQDEYCQQGPT